ncbi:hypothetical protein DRO32_04660 [Candidatus Bathyarchaeota archaeon]|nr:MAG: hypothetical protein DRO32_04660 [Candidatus Bathyarchaeota archaeon]
MDLAHEDPVLNAFIIYDWLYLRPVRPDLCDFYVAVDRPSGRVEAACVSFHEGRFDSLVFCGSAEAVGAILAYIRPSRAVLPRVRPEELGAVLKALGPGVRAIYDTILMTCSPSGLRRWPTDEVVRLGPEHAELYRSLMGGREDRPYRLTPDEARRRLEDPNRPVFAIIRGGRIASTATIYLSMPDVSLVGGVYTIPELRNRGLATSVTCAATEEALRRSCSAALMVRSDNKPALRVYEKVGYAVHERLKWICVGVDYPP